MKSILVVLALLALIALLLISAVHADETQERLRSYDLGRIDAQAGLPGRSYSPEQVGL